MTRNARALLKITFFLGWLTTLALAPLQAQDSASLSENEVEKLEESLTTIFNSIQQTQEALRSKQEELSTAEGKLREQELTEEINQLSSQLSTLQENFSEIATKVDLNEFEPSTSTGALEWDQELKSLLNPLLQSLVRLTSRPREIEKLRSEISSKNDQKVLAQHAIDRLENLKAALTPEDTGETAQDPPPLLQALEQERQKWLGRISNINTQLTISKQRLEQILEEKSSLGQSFSQLFNLFFRSRGRNFLLSLGAMLLFWLIAYRTFSNLQDAKIFQSIRKSFKFRLFNVTYVLGAFLGGIFLFLFILFLFGDWILLTLGLLILLGIAWTSKHAIANYWSQMMLILNVGPVREGERVTINGLPWRVRTLNFYSVFENPSLDGGQLRLPISDVPAMRSKPFDSADPWFPTQKDDWVLIGDETLGKVTTQTPEFVRMFQLGNSIISFPATDFMSMGVKVLSHGFRCGVTFGMDYMDQAGITDAIPEKIHSHVEQRLIEAKFDKDKFKLHVEFEEAGSSSLNLAVFADFNGEYASSYLKLKRRMQQFCVEACNLNGWNIPFPQLTVHMDPKKDDGTADS